MTEQKEAIRETTGGPSPEETVSPKVHVKGVLENFACHPDCRNSDLIEDPTLIVRNRSKSLAHDVILVLEREKKLATDFTRV